MCSQAAGSSCGSVTICSRRSAGSAWVAVTRRVRGEEARDRLILATARRSRHAAPGTARDRADDVTEVVRAELAQRLGELLDDTDRGHRVVKVHGAELDGAGA